MPTRGEGNAGRALLHHEQLKAAIEFVSDGILILSADRVVLYANRAAERLLGASTDGLVGAASPLPVALDRPIAQTLRLGASEAYVEIHAAIMPLEEGETGYCLTVRDVTEHERIQRELTRATRLKDQFIAHVSHELRTPMNGVVGMTSLLLDHALPTELRRYVETIRASGEAMLAIINDLLDLSKIEAGKLHLERGPFDPRALVDETVELFGESARAKGVVVSTTAAPDVPARVLSDATRVRQVLANLVSNAVKFTDHGSVSVTTDVRSAPDGRTLLRFSVADTGIGIAREQQPLLFQPFSQLAGDPLRKQGGTGLGLAISQRLVTLLGGEIRCSSEAGAGACFTFDVVVDVDAPAPALPRPSGDVALVGPLPPALEAAIRRALAASAPSIRSVPLMPADLDGGVAIVDTCRLGRDELLRLAQSPPGRAGRVLALADRPWTLRGARAAGLAALMSVPLKQRDLQEAVERVRQGQALADGLDREAAPARGGEPTPRWAVPRRRVLVAEDHAINQRVVLSMLERLGVEADAVASGVEALEAAREREYDLVLMDCRMPALDGFDATRALRALSPWYASVPIVGVTADPSPNVAERCHDAGMTDCVAKPITLRDLQRLLDGTSSPARTEEPPSPLAAQRCADLDESVLRRLAALTTKDGRSLVAEVLHLFLSAAPMTLDELRGAIAQRDVRAVEHLAHKLGGSARNVGALRLARACAKLERRAAQRDLADADGLVDEVDRALTTTAKRLRRWSPSYASVS
jgi:signal transduction histidine kinase/CheY-like chemotaxis protein